MESILKKIVAAIEIILGSVDIVNLLLEYTKKIYFIFSQDDEYSKF